MLNASGLELVEQVRDLTNGSDLDAVIVPIGGGGLIGGVATAVKALCPGIRVIGAEPEQADDAYRSKMTGEVSDVRRTRQRPPIPRSYLNGVHVRGSLYWPVIGFWGPNGSLIVF